MFKVFNSSFQTKSCILICVNAKYITIVIIYDTLNNIYTFFTESQLTPPIEEHQTKIKERIFIRQTSEKSFMQKYLILKYTLVICRCI